MVLDMLPLVHQGTRPSSVAAVNECVIVASMSSAIESIIRERALPPPRVRRALREASGGGRVRVGDCARCRPPGCLAMGARRSRAPRGKSGPLLRLLGRSSSGNRRMNEVMTVDELADRLRIGRRAAYEAVRRGEIPGVVRIGRTIRVSAAAVDRWLGEDIGAASDER